MFMTRSVKKLLRILLEHRDLNIIIIIIIINLFATNQNIHNNHRVYMMAGRQKN